MFPSLPSESRLTHFRTTGRAGKLVSPFPLSLRPHWNSTSTMRCSRGSRHSRGGSPDRHSRVFPVPVRQERRRDRDPRLPQADGFGWPADVGPGPPAPSPETTPRPSDAPPDQISSSFDRTPGRWPAHCAGPTSVAASSDRFGACRRTPVGGREPCMVSTGARTVVEHAWHRSDSTRPVNDAGQRRPDASPQACAAPTGPAGTSSNLLALGVSPRWS